MAPRRNRPCPRPWSPIGLAGRGRAATALTPPITAQRASSVPKHNDSTYRPQTSRHPSGRSWATTGRCDSGLALADHEASPSMPVQEEASQNPPIGGMTSPENPPFRLVDARNPLQTVAADGRSWPRPVRRFLCAGLAWPRMAKRLLRSGRQGLEDLVERDLWGRGRFRGRRGLRTLCLAGNASQHFLHMIAFSHADGQVDDTRE
jgi:hypothetical protein